MFSHSHTTQMELKKKQQPLQLSKTEINFQISPFEGKNDFRFGYDLMSVFVKFGIKLDVNTFLYLWRHVFFFF